MNSVDINEVNTMSKQKKKKGPTHKVSKKLRNPIQRDMWESTKPSRIPNKRKGDWRYNPREDY